MIFVRIVRGCVVEDLQQFGTEVGSAVTTNSVTECALTCQAIDQCNFWRQALAGPRTS